MTSQNSDLINIMKGFILTGIFFLFSFQLYDQPPVTPRKSLLPKSPSSHAIDAQQQMVEASLFDIYLCDNCDAELYSLDAYTEHEKTCHLTDDGDDTDDDVILVDENELDGRVPMCTDQPDFLSNFGLFSSAGSAAPQSARRKTGSQQYGYMDHFSPDKRRMPARTRAILPLSKCHTIPISSPCGQLLLKQTKTVQSDDYKLERIDRVERFCTAPPANDEQAHSRYLSSLSRLRGQTSNNVTFRKPTEQPEDYHYHVYKWPRRQFSTKLRQAHFLFLNSLLLKACRPLSVKIKRLSDTDIEIQKAKLRLAAQKVSFAVPRVKPKVVEYIDLCSSDEEREPGDESVSPRSVEVENNKAVNNISRIVDENQLQQKVDGIVMSMPVNNPVTFPVNQVGVQPLRPSVFLFSNYQNAASNTSFFQSNQDSISKSNSIKQWLESQSGTTLPVRKIPRLVNIQQYATTTIITAADVAT